MRSTATGTGTRLLAVIVLGAAALVSALAHGQLVIDVRQGVARPYPIAIVPFGWEGPGQPAYDIAGVITADLASSGRFAPIPVGDMVSRPTQPAQVNFQDWR